MPYRRRRRRFVRTRWALLAALGVVMVVGLMIGWRVYHVRQELNDARTSAEVLQAALEQRDAARARAALDSLRLHSASAAEQTDGTIWAAISHSPVVGDDAAAVASMSQVLDSLARDALGPAVSVVTGIADGQFSPRRGRIPVEEIVDLQGPVARASDALDEAGSRLSELDGSYIAQVADARRQLGDTVQKARGQIRSARNVVDLAPAMLGVGKSRRYLLVLQNNAEIRATGGFPGSLFVLTATEGRISLGESFAPRLSEVSKPVLDLTSAERELFGQRVGTRFVDAGRQPDFARVAEIWQANLRERSGLEVDGVLTMDPVTLSYLMSGFSPIVVDGVELSARNVVSELLNATYFRITDPDAQDLFFRQVGSAVLDALLEASDPEALVNALQQAADEGRLLLASNDVGESRVLAETPLAGTARTLAKDADAVGVFLSDQTRYVGSKLSYYLSSAVRVEESCDRQNSWSARLALASSAPDPSTLPVYITGQSSDPPPGAPVNVVARGVEELELLVLAPRTGRISSVRSTSGSVDVTRARYLGRDAVRLVVDLPPGGSVDVTWQMTGADVASVVQTPSIRQGIGDALVTRCN